MSQRLCRFLGSGPVSHGGMADVTTVSSCQPLVRERIDTHVLACARPGASELRGMDH